jgi:hypothetical protein
MWRSATAAAPATALLHRKGACDLRPSRLSAVGEHLPRNGVIPARAARLPAKGTPMSIGLILLIILVIFLLGGFSGRFGGYGYGYGHGGMGVLGIILVIIVILMLLGRI